jgi:hypothetical protein
MCRRSQRPAISQCKVAWGAADFWSGSAGLDSQKGTLRRRSPVHTPFKVADPRIFNFAAAGCATRAKATQQADRHYSVSETRKNFDAWV